MLVIFRHVYSYVCYGHINSYVCHGFQVSSKRIFHHAKKHDIKTKYVSIHDVAMFMQILKL